jgi:Ca-activated chloride channel family protein
MDAPAAVGGTKLHAAQAAARTFLEQLGQADHGALVSFDSAARRDVGLTGDHAAVVQALERLTTTRGTRLELGLAEARRTLTEQGRPDATAVVVLLTDGLSGSGPEPVRAEAAALREAGVMVFAIGLGAVVDAELLREVATTREAYFASPSAADLASIYRQISERLACGRP